MAIVTYILRENEPLTPEEEAELEALENRKPVYDEDNPPMTEEEYNFYSMLSKKYKTRRVTKEMVLKELEARGKNFARG